MIQSIFFILAFCAAQPVFADTPAPTDPVSTVEVKLPILVDSSQLTVYVYDKDQPGVSNCYNGCATAWPPLLHTGAAPAAPFSVVTRTDGTSQLAYQGKPLYTYAGDSQPGDITGNGLGGVWHVVANPILPASNSGTN